MCKLSRSSIHARSGRIEERWNRWHRSDRENSRASLNTVRDLLGHSSVAMSLRYGRLPPDQRRDAIAKLNEKPLLALTLRLQGNQGFHSDFLPH